MLQKILQDETQSALLYLSLALLGMVVLYIIVDRTLRAMGKNPKYLLPKGTIRRVARPLILILFSLLLRMEALRSLLGLEDYAWYFRKAGTLLFIFAFTWLVIRALRVVKKVVIAQYDVGDSDNLKARKIYTQFTILERIVIFIIIILALGLALMSFEGIRRVGISVFASAGVAGIIIGFSAQKLIATILAGIQIAITQPIRLDDVVIVEGEWGRIEEITLTYVTIAIWDKRRLVVPTTYFIEKPFQNWTKTTSDILGTVFIYTDYTVPVDAIRKELDKIVKQTELWDGQVANVQVTNVTAAGVEVRALVSASDAGRAWDLRVLTREKLIDFLQREYPESLARTRVLLQGET
ncbi:Small-conductance mechanosensitive channel [Robiginitalea myxolifaciens]|uniref:Small-conductance mechanosensitive channel n=1 Tax=Robiginitalea myxolifaciens TaxID=400055 RepID=A0A1I6G0E7_9FLAO|nr:mechanosensitive ion channel domain-containing protein [Robiginitalea myxolifaciens]SFR35683.1 Small-conductance mechanosensitive channel [Robiginitalea myxolifaciens]